MVVDDDEAMCTFLGACLTSRGYRAITVGNAEDAVARYQVQRPAAVALSWPWEPEKTRASPPRGDMEAPRGRREGGHRRRPA